VKDLKILQRTAQGDAVGAGYEYVPQNKVQHFHLSDGYIQHAKHTEIRPGMWTDDTMMSVAVASSLFGTGNSWDMTEIERHTLRLADNMVALHRSHWTKGYSSGMLAALDDAALAEDAGGKRLSANFDKHGRSQNNGSAMRSAAYGIVPDLHDVRELATAGAILTHSGLGVEGAVVVAMVSHFFVFDLGTQEQMDDFLGDHGFATYTTRMRERVAAQNGPLTFLSVTAALTAIRESRTLSGVLERSIRVGGDVDTVAAIAMGLAGSCNEIEDDLPPYIDAEMQPVAGLSVSEIIDLDKGLTKLAFTV
jgi:ADP-ribosylglycohydrolase